METTTCPHCAEEILIEAKKCKHCNEWLEERKDVTPNFSKEVPLWKFIFFSIISFGIYELVWMYRNWKELKAELSLDVSPFWRSFFSALFLTSFVKNLKVLLEKSGFHFAYPPALLGILYFGILLTQRAPGPYWLLCYLTVLPLIPVVRGMNKYWNKKEGQLPTNKLEWWKILLIVFGVGLTGLSLFATFMPGVPYDDSPPLSQVLMEEVAEEINKELPIFLDNETKLDRVDGFENRLRYNYTLVNISRADLVASGVDLQAELAAGLIDGVCDSAEMEMYVKNGATIEYVYFDQEGALIEEIVIDTPTDCS